MNRRMQWKLKNLRLFSRKYIFNSRYTVRNLTAVLTLCTAAGAIGVSANLIGTGLKTAARETTGTEAVSASTERRAEPAEYEITLTDASLLDPDQTAELSQTIEDENQVEMQVNPMESLSASEYDMEGKFLAVGDQVNIRTEASPEGDPTGVLPKGATGKVLGTEGDWTEIESGDVTGYVKSEYLITDEEAAAKAEEMETTLVTVRSNDVSVRAESGKESDVLYLADDGDQFSVAEPEEEDTEETDTKETDTDTNADTEEDGDSDDAVTGWTEVDLADGTTAYIATSYLDSEKGFRTAVSLEEIDKLASEKSDYQEKLDSQRGSSDAEKETIDEADSTEEEVGGKEQSAPASSAQTSSGDSSSTSAAASPQSSSSVSVSSDELTLLAAIVYAESGNQPYEGQLAVANIVLNRLRSGKYGGSIAEIIYAPSQFTAISSPAFQQALYSPNATSLAAARDALGGNNNVPGLYQFRPTWAAAGYSGLQIGDQIFF